MFTNRTKAKLQAGESVFGIFTRFADATLVELLGFQGWDFVVFDGEHSTMEAADVEHMTRAAELRGMTPIVRVPANSVTAIPRMMDTGVHGVQVPWVNTSADAEQVVQMVKYPPVGMRGLAAVRPNGYGQAETMADYIQVANLETLVVTQIESAQAVDHIPDLVQVPGVDVLFIGPRDLSTSLGVPGQKEHPRMQAATTRVRDVVTTSDKALGIMVANLAEARHWQRQGARYITIAVDSLLIAAAKGYLGGDRN